MEYVCDEPAHTPAVPVMAPGCATVATLTARLCAALVPQPLVAATVRVPPALLAVAVIEFTEEEPLHPAGSSIYTPLLPQLLLQNTFARSLNISIRFR